MGADGGDRTGRDDPFDLVGDVLDGQYRVDAVAGEGDLSVVYKGHHLGVDAPVAIKCLNLPATLDPALVRPLVDDFREASRVHYRLARGSLHIAQTVGSGQTIAPRTGTTVPYLVREWFEGESLATDLARRSREGKKGRAVEEVVALLDPAVEAIVYAHGQGTPHLSINPSNLFLAQRDGKRSLVVLDFGVARTMNEIASGLPSDALSTGGLRVLFPAYAAPEQLDRSLGDTGPWTDVYALALVFMELLSDRPVMDGAETGALVDRALHETKRPTPAAHGLHLSRNLDLVLARAVAKAPTKRQQDAGSFWRDVNAALSGSATRIVKAATDGPRPGQSPTLMGIAPSFAVAGAVRGRSRASSAARVETRPMSFEPESLTASTAEEPPPVAPVAPVQTITAKLPPPPDPPPPPPTSDFDSRTPPAWAMLPPRAASRAATIALVSLGSLSTLAMVWALVAFVSASLRAGSDMKAAAIPAIAASVPPEAVAPTPPIGSAPAAVSADSAPPTASSAPLVTAHFSAAAVKRAFDAASRDVARCKRGARWGVANATVTFDPDGTVKRVSVGPPFGGTPTGRCVGDLLKSVHIPAFQGAPVIWVTPFYVAAR
ncbi:MAG TPA: serine/threonine-protein kinase [Polyangiaceae bacterium]